MATAKKKAPAKKPAAKRKNAAARATNKKTTAKAPVIKAAKVTKQTNKLTRFQLLRRFHIFSAIISLAIAIAAVIFLNTQTVNLTLPYSTQDPIASNEQVVLGPAIESIATIEYRYLVAGVFALCGLLSLLLATVWRNRYEQGLNNATAGIRWAVMGITTGLLLQLVALLAGVQDLVTLKLIAGLVLTTTILGWIADRDNVRAAAPSWGAYGLSLFTGALAWLPVVVTLLGTYIFGLERFGWHVYVVVVLVLLGFSRIAVTQYRYIKYPKVRGEYVNAEEKYLSAELLTKLVFAAVIFTALV